MPLELIPELIPMRLERFVELRRSAWLSTTMFSPAKDVSAMPSTAVAEPTRGDVEIEQDLGDELFPVRQIASNNHNGSSSNGSRIETDDSGIKWRYATQGSQLQEASTRHRGDDVAFARKSYIDGVVYMLKALPDDMDELERAAIRQAAATSCKDAVSGEDGGRVAAHHPRGRLGYDGRPVHGEKTFLHRCVQASVALLVLLAWVLFCLFKEGVRMGARYERRYNISQVLIERGVVAASTVGKYSVVLRARINAMSETQAGHAVGALTAWTLENVLAGVQDGLGEGMQMLKKQP